MMTSPRVRRTVRAAVVVAAALLSQSGCGYSLSGRGSFLPAYIRIIGVPTFVNATPIFNIEEPITASVRSEFIGRGKYTVKPESTAVDGLLTGEITSVTLVPASFVQGLASRYALIITAKIEFKDTKADKVLWSNPAMQFREEYDVPSAQAAVDAGTFLGQNQNALTRLSSEFARTIVSAILEAF
jgi:hypothetical protein